VPGDPAGGHARVDRAAETRLLPASKGAARDAGRGGWGPPGDASFLPKFPAPPFTPAGSGMSDRGNGQERNGAAEANLLLQKGAPRGYWLGGGKRRAGFRVKFCPPRF